jgi:CSLREA domain-containing protein
VERGGGSWETVRRGIIAALVVVLGVLVLAAAAAAAPITVNTTTDTLTGSQCSLRAAIQAANADAAVAGCAAGSGTDTITLPAGDYKLTIGPSGSDDNSSGDLDITSNLTIQGAGAAATTVDANGLDRVFSISAGEVATIAGMTITGGHAATGGGFPVIDQGPDSDGNDGGTGENGGGILDLGSLTLSADVVSGNRAGAGASGGNASNGGTGVVSPPSGVNPCQGGHSIGGPGGPGGSGGGIAVENGFLTLDSTQVTDNHAGAGGSGGSGASGGAGLAGDSCGKLGADLKDGGSAGFSEGGTGGAGGSGGGIAFNGSSGAVNATDCTISGNVAGDGGAGGSTGAGGAGGNAGTGAVDADGGNGGAAVGGAGGGGGSGGGLEVFASGSPLPINLTGCAVTANAAGGGGGGGAGNDGGNGGFAIDTSGNVGGIGGAGDGGNGGNGGAGGGLALLQSAMATIADSTIADNTTGAGADGGPADSGGAGGLGGAGFSVESDGGEAVGGRGGSGGGGAAAADQGQSSAALSDDTIAGNGGGIGGNGGHGGVSANVAISSEGGNGGSAGGVAIAVSVASATLSHDTVDANAVGAPGAGGPGGGPNTGNPDGPGAGGAPAAAGGLEGPLTLTASIVSGDPGGDCAASSGITDGGHNLTSAGSTCLVAVGDPKLGALADNGGPTQTQALGNGSAALGAIPAASGLCGGHDQRGVPRPAGAPCDIGAYQVAGPTAVTGGVSGVSETHATLAGSVTVNDPSATVHFDYGKDTAYGSTTTTQMLGAGVTPTAVSAALTGLAPNTTYHYRIVATTRDGTSNGADATFKTSASGSAPGGGGGGSFAGLKIVKQSVKLTAKRVAPIKVSCPAATAGSCKGTLTVTIKVRSSKRVKVHHKLKLVHRTKTVKLGSVRFAVVAGHKATLKAKLSRAAVARVKRAGKLKTTATAKATDSAGDAKTTHATVTLHRYVKPRTHKHGR